MKKLFTIDDFMVAFISALGYAIIYLRKSSTGGSDFVIMSVKALKPHLSLGNITFAIDGAIILIGGLMFSDADGIIYGIMMSFLMSMVIDKVMYGVDRGKVALIVTEHGEEIAFEVERVTGRGATFLKAQGSFSKLDKQVVMIACDNKEMFRVQQVAKQCDPKACTVVLESSEVLGEGFKVD